MDQEKQPINKIKGFDETDSLVKSVSRIIEIQLKPRIIEFKNTAFTKQVIFPLWRLANIELPMESWSTSRLLTLASLGAIGVGILLWFVFSPIRISLLERVQDNEAIVATDEIVGEIEDNVIVRADDEVQFETLYNLQVVGELRNGPRLQQERQAASGCPSSLQETPKDEPTPLPPPSAPKDDPPPLPLSFHPFLTVTESGDYFQPPTRNFVIPVTSFPSLSQLTPAEMQVVSSSLLLLSYPELKDASGDDDSLHWDFEWEYEGYCGISSEKALLAVDDIPLDLEKVYDVDFTIYD